MQARFGGQADAPEMGANADDHERLFATSFHAPNLVGGLASFARSGRELVDLLFGAMEDEYRLAAKIP